MKKKLRPRRKRNFFDLTPEQRARDIKQFDREIDIERDTRPLTVKERSLFERIVADKPNESRHVVNGHHDRVVQLDEELWTKATAFAKKNKTTLPKVIDRALRGLLAFAE